MTLLLVMLQYDPIFFTAKDNRARQLDSRTSRREKSERKNYVIQHTLFNILYAKHKCKLIQIISYMCWCGTI